MSYAEGKRFDEAIVELEEAAKSPQRRTQALAMLGACEIQRGNFAAALKNCDDALAEMVRMDRHRYEVMYNRAEALEKLGRQEDALAGFQEIYRNNARFKDVPDRIKALGGEID